MVQLNIKRKSPVLPINQRINFTIKTSFVIEAVISLKISMSPRTAHPAVEAVLYFRIYSVFFPTIFNICTILSRKYGIFSIGRISYDGEMFHDLQKWSADNIVHCIPKSQADWEYLCLYFAFAITGSHNIVTGFCVSDVFANY